MNKPFGDYVGEVTNNLKGGLDHLKTHLRECLLIVVPLSLANAIVRFVTVGTLVTSGALMSSTDPEQHPMAAGALLGIFTLSFAAIAFLALFAPIALYGMFCKLRFVVQSHQDSGRAFSLGDLWRYESIFIPFVGLELVQWLLGIPVLFVASLVGLITFFLFGIPGLLLISLYGMFMACSCFAFLEQPTRGVVTALSRGFRLVSSDWKRWLALSLVGAVVMIVVNILQGILGATVGAIPLIGPAAMLFVGFLSVMYFAIVGYRCYRDSCVAVGE